MGIIKNREKRPEMAAVIPLPPSLTRRQTHKGDFVAGGHAASEPYAPICPRQLPCGGTARYGVPLAGLPAGKGRGQGDDFPQFIYGPLSFSNYKQVR